MATAGLPPNESSRIKRAYVDNVEPTHATMLLEETHRRRYAAIIRALRDMGAQSVLDLGCGEGNLERQIKGSELRLKRVLGCDLNLTKLRRINETSTLSDSLDLVRADAERLPFRPHVTDVVVATEVIEHVPDEGQALSELARLGARQYIITVPALGYPPFLLALGSERVQGWAKSEPRHARRLIRPFQRAARWSEIVFLPIFLVIGIVRGRGLEYYDYRLYHGNVPHRLYTMGYLVRTLEACGFALDEIKGVGFSLPYLSELEVIARWRGPKILASVCARLQAALDERFSRRPDASQNLMAVVHLREEALEKKSAA